MAQPLRYEQEATKKNALPGDIVIDRRLTQEDIDWLRKLRNAKAANQLSADIPTSVVRRLTQLACAEVRGGKTAITFRGRDELIERERELS
jgi:hypothetical protein